MKHLLQCIIIISFVSCADNQSGTKKELVENFNCTEGQMQPAWYEHGMDEQVPDIGKLKNKFLIVVNPRLKAINFISAEEDNLRYPMYLNTGIDEEWTANNGKPNPNKVSQRQADAIYLANNSGKQQVWIINNAEDTVGVQMQDGSYICVLEAKTKTGKWLPIQYWRFSTCGNSYYHKYFPPKTANSFVAELPSEGNYKTKMRYKLLGSNRYYFSNEFNGKINYCQFVEDKRNYTNYKGHNQPHFKLDSLKLLSREFPRNKVLFLSK